MNALFFLLLSVVGVGSLECLDGIESQYVAPGWTVVEEAVIDPLQYGEPMEGSSIVPGAPTVGIWLNYVGEPPEQTLRIVLVYADRVVVLNGNEDDDIQQVRLDIDPERFSISPNGKFVLVYNRDQGTQVVDTGDMSIERFAPTRGSITDNGEVISQHGDSLLFYDSDLTLRSKRYCNMRWSFDLVGDGSYVISNHLDADGNYSLVLYSSDGELILEEPLGPEGDIPAFVPYEAAALAHDPDLLLVASSSALTVIDIPSGDLVYQRIRPNPLGLGVGDRPTFQDPIYFPRIGQLLVTSSQYRSYSIEEDLSARQMAVGGVNVLTIEDDEFSFQTLSEWNPGRSWVPEQALALAAGNRILFRSYEPRGGHLRYSIIQGEQILWASEPFSLREARGGNPSPMHTRKSAMDLAGERVAYFDGNMIHTIRLGRGE